MQYYNNQRSHNRLLTQRPPCVILAEDIQWMPGDVVTCHFPMSIRRVKSHPKVESNTGKVALMRGPLLYCIESADHEGNLDDIYLPEGTALFAEAATEDVLGIDCVLIRSTGLPKNIAAVPCFLWSNRGPGAMKTWMSESNEEPEDGPDQNSSQ